MIIQKRLRCYERELRMRNRKDTKKQLGQKFEALNKNL